MRKSLPWRGIQRAHGLQAGFGNTAGGVAGDHDNLKKHHQRNEKNFGPVSQSHQHDDDGQKYYLGQRIEQIHNGIQQSSQPGNPPHSQPQGHCQRRRQQNTAQDAKGTDTKMAAHLFMKEALQKGRKRNPWRRQKGLLQGHTAQLPEQQNQSKTQEAIEKFSFHELVLQSSCAADCNAHKTLQCRDSLPARCAYSLRYAAAFRCGRRIRQSSVPEKLLLRCCGLQ